MRAATLTVLALAIPAAALAMPTQGVLPWTGHQQPRGAALLRSAMVEGHNRARRHYGVAPLAWDEALARDAAAYAARLTSGKRPGR